jgi:hypothetical protein
MGVTLGGCATKRFTTVIDDFVLLATHELAASKS